jgi:RNA polymerase sigma factor (TIGR02999 family)
MDGNSARDDLPQTLDELIPLAYEELRRVARQRLAQLPPGKSFSATDLVNDVLLRLLKRTNRQYNGREHLIRTAAMAMHDALVDRARRKKAAKRSDASKQVALHDDLHVVAPAHDMLAFDEACNVVRAHSEANFELLLLRVYAGLSTAEIAEQRGQSKRTIERQWRFVKALIAAHLQVDDDLGPTPSPSAT